MSLEVSVKRQYSSLLYQRQFPWAENHRQVTLTVRESHQKFSRYNPSSPAVRFTRLGNPLPTVPSTVAKQPLSSQTQPHPLNSSSHSLTHHQSSFHSNQIVMNSNLNDSHSTHLSRNS